VVSFLQVSPPKPCLPYVPQGPPTSLYTYRCLVQWNCQVGRLKFKLGLLHPLNQRKTQLHHEKCKPLVLTNNDQRLVKNSWEVVHVLFEECIHKQDMSVWNVKWLCVLSFQEYYPKSALQTVHSTAMWIHIWQFLQDMWVKIYTWPYSVHNGLVLW
jgi:hypothetical protein